MSEDKTTMEMAADSKQLSLKIAKAMLADKVNPKTGLTALLMTAASMARIIGVGDDDWAIVTRLAWTGTGKARRKGRDA